VAASIVYSARYCIDIGLHVFPTSKYQLIVERLLKSGLIRESDIVEPAPASWADLALVHTSEYLNKLRDGGLSDEDLAQLELPWSREMVEAFRTMVGGTILAARFACGFVNCELGTFDSEEGSSSKFGVPSSKFRVACHIGGGLHHAFPNHGEGFCPFNDVAVAVRVLQTLGVERHAIVDLDVHHGNGTAFIFESDPRVYTLSMHQQHNYPMWKPRGSRDIGLSDGVHDATYLRELERALPDVFAHRPGCVFYLAGADPFEDDQLGGLRLTKDGLRQRDRMVVAAARDAAVPLVVVLAGGYARNVEDTVGIHCATIHEIVSLNSEVSTLRIPEH
jgi:acetoin utilization deacetylase AcuC-like enzyme